MHHQRDPAKRLAIASLIFAVASVFAFVPSVALASRPFVFRTFPVHGIVLALPRRDEAIVHTDPVAGIAPSVSRLYRLPAPSDAPLLRSGTEVDGIVETQPFPRLTYLTAAPRFVAGLPRHNVVRPLHPGDRVPDAPFVDQEGRLVRLHDFAGSVVILSFVFTRCHDECPTISARFAKMQRLLARDAFRLVLVTMDPTFDSPAILRDYGRGFGADPARWSLLSGKGSDVSDMLVAFGISELEDRPGDFLHNDKLVIVDGRGMITSMITTSAWSPDEVVARARQIAGLASNPLRRLELAAIDGIAALCGGNAALGAIIFESLSFLIGAGLCLALLAWFAWRMWAAR